MAHAAPMARDERRLSQSSPPESTARARVQKREESVENRSSCYHVGWPNGPTKDNPLYPRLLVRGYTGSEEGEQDLYEPGQPRAGNFNLKTLKLMMTKPCLRG